MRWKEKQPHKVCWVGGRRFAIHLEYYEQMEGSYPEYPNFAEHPEYTGGGRPFAMAAQESCPHAEAKAAGRPAPADCGGCGWFYREQTPYDPIGVCMCDARRNEPESKREEKK